jgi:hypothetical protein
MVKESQIKFVSHPDTRKNALYKTSKTANSSLSNISFLASKKQKYHLYKWYFSRCSAGWRMLEPVSVIRNIYFNTIRGTNISFLLTPP